MNFFVVFIASGQSFFAGALLIVCATLVGAKARSTWSKRLDSLVLFLGLLLAILSATPLPIFVWLVLCGCTVCLFRRSLSTKKWLVGLVCTMWCTAAINETRWQLTPQLPQQIQRQNLPLVVLADSVTAGLGEGEAITWPQLLASKSEFEVIDLSHVGETVASATKRSQQYELPEHAVFILELGGNDILGSASSAQFEADLEKLLASLDTPNHHIFMFELPLIPFHNSWGLIQRKAATKHGVLLIPKWRLASVFSGSTSTVDSIHLSQEGHNRMQEIVTTVLGLPSRSWVAPDLAS